MPRIELRHLSKRYPSSKVAVSNLDITIQSGELLAVLGPSGSGKSTLLRLIAGLETPSAGSVRIDDRDCAGLAARDRDVAFVFQNQSPFPHLNVEANLAFGARSRGVARSEIDARVQRASASLGIADSLNRMPGTLSGGERQRVALGRAIVRQPSILLLDEPFSNLDAPLRRALRADLIHAHQAMKTTTIFVTHDQQEAVAVGDRIAVLHEGKLRQIGSAEELLDKPACEFVAGFLGDPPMGTVRAEVVAFEGVLQLVFPSERLTQTIEVPVDASWGNILRTHGPRAYRMGIRHDSLLALQLHESWDRPTLTMKIERIERRGTDLFAMLEDTHGMWVRLDPGHGAQEGDTLRVGMDLDRASWFDPETSLNVVRCSATAAVAEQRPS